ncbi:6459_t:CDS:2 [Rhizophagus irregularis]|nr:6459_t:CDS:2 [Rhizophagus irregularis]
MSSRWVSKSSSDVGSDMLVTSSTELVLFTTRRSFFWWFFKLPEPLFLRFGRQLSYPAFVMNKFVW